jgi:hypothetical protein
MFSDEDARNAVRRLIQRLEAISDQSVAVAYVLARRDAKEYEQLLKAAEIAEETVIRPLAEAEGNRSQIYAALEDPTVDWAKGVNTMLDRGPICFHGGEVLVRARFVQTLDERFDAKMKTQIQKQEE